MITDLRSDTVTKPSAGMLAAMNNALVGDDVFQEDPTVNSLEQIGAAMFGKEAAIFCPSGTMTNQIAIKLHTQPGEEVICEAESHVYIYEGGGIAFNSGCQVKTIMGDRGRIKAAQIENCINPDDVHKAPTRLVSLEDTCNRGGGSYYDLETMQEIRTLCTDKKLGLHLDGARLFNALVESGQQAQDIGTIFDTISVCLSKGLGAPVGSLLLGSFDHIKKARRFRKVFGGGMRQAGYLAAAGIYALDNNIERLKEDHQHAKIVAAVLLEKDFCGHMLPVDTNIIIFEVKGRFTAKSLVEKLAESNILCFAINENYIRFVFHLDVSEQKTDDLVKTIEYL